jgi:hypothetical protein
MAEGTKLATGYIELTVKYGGAMSAVAKDLQELEAKAQQSGERAGQKLGDAMSQGLKRTGSGGLGLYSQFEAELEKMQSSWKSFEDRIGHAAGSSRAWGQFTSEMRADFTAKAADMGKALETHLQTAMQRNQLQARMQAKEMATTFAEGGKEAGSKFSEFFKNQFIQFAGIVGVATSVGEFIRAGFENLSVIEDTQVKLESLGMTGDRIKDVFRGIQDATAGTAYSFTEILAPAAAAAAAGIPEQLGVSMQKYTKTVEDVAALSGAGFDQISNMMTKAATRDKATVRDLIQLAENNVPFSQWLREDLGISQSDVDELISKGDVTFQMYFETMQNHAQGAAERMGDTLGGQLHLIGQNVGSIAQAVMEPFFGQAGGAVKSLNDKLADFATWLHAHQPEIVGFFETVADKAFGMVEGVMHALQSAAGKVGEILKDIGKGEGIFDFLPDSVLKGLTDAGNSFSNFSDSIGRGADNVDKLKGKLDGGFDNMKYLAELSGIFEENWSKAHVASDGMSIEASNIDDTQKGQLQDRGFTVKDLGNGQVQIAPDASKTGASPWDDGKSVFQSAEAAFEHFKRTAEEDKVKTSADTDPAKNQIESLPKQIGDGNGLVIPAKLDVDKSALDNLTASIGLGAGSFAFGNMGLGAGSYASGSGVELGPGRTDINAPVVPGTGSNYNIVDWMKNMVNVFDSSTATKLSITADREGATGKGVEPGDVGHPLDKAWHSMNRAVDISGPTADMAKFVQWWTSNPANVASTLELIHNDSLGSTARNIKNGQMGNGFDIFGSDLMAQHGPDPSNGGHVHLALQGVPISFDGQGNMMIGSGANAFTVSPDGKLGGGLFGSGGLNPGSGGVLNTSAGGVALSDYSRPLTPADLQPGPVLPSNPGATYDENGDPNPAPPVTPAGAMPNPLMPQTSSGKKPKVNPDLVNNPDLANLPTAMVNPYTGAVNPYAAPNYTGWGPKPSEVNQHEYELRGINREYDQMNHHLDQLNEKLKQEAALRDKLAAIVNQHPNDKDAQANLKAQQQVVDDQQAQIGDLQYQMEGNRIRLQNSNDAWNDKLNQDQYRQDKSQYGMDGRGVGGAGNGKGRNPFAIPDLGQMSSIFQKGVTEEFLPPGFENPLDNPIVKGAAGILGFISGMMPDPMSKALFAGAADVLSGKGGGSALMSIIPEQLGGRMKAQQQQMDPSAVVGSASLGMPGPFGAPSGPLPGPADLATPPGGGSVYNIGPQYNGAVIQGADPVQQAQQAQTAQTNAIRAVPQTQVLPVARP